MKHIELTHTERRRFALYLRQQARTERALVEQQREDPNNPLNIVARHRTRIAEAQELIAHRLELG